MKSELDFEKKDDLERWCRKVRKEYSKPIKIPRVTFYFRKTYSPGNFSTKKLSHGGCHISNRVLFSRGGKKQENFRGKLKAHLDYIQREAQYQNIQKGLEEDIKKECDFTLKSLDRDLTTEEVLKENPKIYCKHQMIFSPEHLDKLSDGQVDDLMYSINDYIKNNNKYNADFKLYYTLHRDTDHHHCHIVLTSPGFLFLGRKEIFELRELASNEVHQAIEINKSKEITFKKSLVFESKKTLEIKQEVNNELNRRGSQASQGITGGDRAKAPRESGQAFRKDQQPNIQYEARDLPGARKDSHPKREAQQGNQPSPGRSDSKDGIKNGIGQKQIMDLPGRDSTDGRDSRKLNNLDDRKKEHERDQSLDRDKNSHKKDEQHGFKDGRGISKKDDRGMERGQDRGRQDDLTDVMKSLNEGFEKGGYKKPEMGKETIIFSKVVEKKIDEGYHKQELDKKALDDISKAFDKGFYNQSDEKKKDLEKGKNQNKNKGFEL